MEIVTSRQNLADVNPKLAAKIGRELHREPASIELVRKAYISIKEPEILEGERAVIATISTETPDRDQEVMLMKGADLKWFRQNPIVFYAHDYGDLPIGQAQWIRKDGNSLVAKTVFATAEANPLADQVYRLIQGKFLRAWSIGFIINEAREAKADEFPDAQVRRVITKWSLLEYSAVGVPSNMEALTTAVGKGLKLDERLAADLGVRILVEDVPEKTHEVVGKPYANEHACRLQEPGKFDRFRRGDRNHEGKTYAVIYGHPKAGGGWEEQAYRYNKETWSTDQARGHCKAHEGRFEAAKGATDGASCVECGEVSLMDRRVANIEMELTRLRGLLAKPEPVAEGITFVRSEEPKVRIDDPEGLSRQIAETIRQGIVKGFGALVDQRIDKARGRVREI